MTKNLMPIIAKELGVEIGEEFKFSGNQNVFTYRFTNEEIQSKCKGRDWGTSVIDLNVVLKQEIIKLPFEPKTGEQYWTCIGEIWHVIDTLWEDRAIDCFRKHCGCVFRTKEEAIAALPAKYRELTGKEWKENG